MTALTGAPSPWAAVRAIWDRLPLLAAVNVAVAVVTLPAALLVLGGLAPLAPLVALTPAGAVIATVAVAGPARRAARLAAAPGAAVGAVLGGVLTLGAATLRLYQHTGARWLLGPLFVDGTAATLAVVASLYAFGLIALTPLRGRPLWTAGLTAAASAPATTVAALFVLLVAGLLVAVIGPGMLLLLPGPVMSAVHTMTAGVVAEQGSPDD